MSGGENYPDLQYMENSGVYQFNSGLGLVVASQRNRPNHLDNDLSIIIRWCNCGWLNAFLMPLVTQRDNRRVKPFRCSQQWAQGPWWVHAGSSSSVAVYLPTACALCACGRFLACSFAFARVCIHRRYVCMFKDTVSVTVEGMETEKPLKRVIIC